MLKRRKQVELESNFNSHRNMALTTVLAFMSVTMVLGVSSALLNKMVQHYIYWDGGMKPCDGVENKFFDLDKLVVQKKSKSLIALVGDAVLTRNTTTEVKYRLTIFKKINGNYEYQFVINEDNFCPHIAEKNKPWTPFVTEMGIKGCPIPKKVYTFKDSTLDTAGFPLTPLMAGEYRGKVELFEEGKRALCLIAEASVQPIDN